MTLRPRGGRPKKTSHEHPITGNAIINSLVVAEMLGCSDEAAMDLMREGAILSKFAGRGWLTTTRMVLEYLESGASERSIPARKPKEKDVRPTDNRDA